MNIADILTEFGAYYLNNGQNAQRLKTLIFTKEKTELILQTIFTDETRWQGSKAMIDDLTQPFQKAWTPQGTSTFTAIVIELFKQKVDYEEYPDDLEGSWLGFLADNNLDRKTWPIIRWLVENLIIPKMKQEFELQQIFSGRQHNPVVNTPGKPYSTMNGLRYLRNKAILDGKTSPIVIGAWDSDNAILVDQFEAFADGIGRDYWDLAMTLGVSEDLLRRYKRGFREKYGKDMDFEGSQGRIIDTNITMAGLASHRGSNVVWCTPSGNAVRLVKKNENIGKFMMETEDRKVKLFSDFWKGAGFVLGELIFTNDLETGAPTFAVTGGNVPAAGGNIAVTGRDLKGVTSGTLNGQAISNISIVDDRNITFDAPSVAAGSRDLILTNEFGNTTLSVTVA